MDPSIFLGVAVCLSPILLVWAGYLWGRYGLPVEIRRRRLADRRAAQLAPAEEESTPAEVYRYNPTNN